MTVKSTTGKAAGMPQKIFSLRKKLGQKAKREPKFRFYSLYGHIFRKDVLRYAFRLVKRNQGAPGIDGVKLSDIDEGNGIKQLVDDLHEELKTRSYKPQPVLRAYIPKADGGKRPLGIPTVRDRTVQMAVLLILEPIFEADFLDCSYGFRPGRSAHQAIKKISDYLNQGYTAVYDADLKGYFDNIPHDKLMACLGVRISDRSILKLLRLWLQSPVAEPDDNGDPVKGKWHRSMRGTPQGRVISPLLANIYLHWFDVKFHRRTGPATWANAKLVRYADDFVVLSRFHGPQLIVAIEKALEDWLDLRLNREKTRVITLRDNTGEFDFLGYRIRFCKGKRRSGKGYLHVSPSKKALGKARQRIKEITDRKWFLVPIPNMIERVNLFLTGWGRYFSLGYPNKAFQKLNHYASYRVIYNLRKRSQRGHKKPKLCGSYEYLKRLGLTRISKRMFMSRECQ